MVHSYICEYFDCFRGHTHYTAIEYYSCTVAIYDVRSSHIVSIRTGLKSRLIWDWSAVTHTMSASGSSLYVENGKRPRTCRRISIHYYYETSFDTCRDTNNVWPLIGSKFAFSKQLKARQSRQNQVLTGHFKAKTGTMWVRLANRRAAGVWFTLGFRMYLFLAKKWPCIPFLEKTLYFFVIFRIFLGLQHFLWPTCILAMSKCT